MSRALRLGLTGGVGSGKSTALAAFARHGAATLSSDAVVHDLLRRPDVRDALARALGPSVLDGGQVSRPALAERIFADDDARRLVEAELHPRVADAFEAWAAVREAEGATLLVHEVPLLFEAGLEDRYDVVALVTAPDEVRRERAPERFERGRHQLPETDKRARADLVYDNVGSPDDLDAWAAEAIRRLTGS